MDREGRAFGDGCCGCDGRWLVYAQAPLADRQAVQITIPEGPQVTIDIPRAGVFCHVAEPSGKTEPVAVLP